MQTPQKIAVVGSGLVGTLLAIYLKRAGHIVHVFDRSPDIRTIQFSGRSINLVMSDRGWMMTGKMKMISMMTSTKITSTMMKTNEIKSKLLQRPVQELLTPDRVS